VVREGAECVVREGVGAGGEMNQALYAHMNSKRKRKKKRKQYINSRFSLLNILT
jgi:NaMN:DMB phosphoribosyltransferase